MFMKYRLNYNFISEKIIIYLLNVYTMTYENIGCTIQKIIHNTPVSVSANSYTTTVATSGGDVYMAGFIGNKIQYCFEDIVYNNDIVGHVVETRSGDYKVWLLNEHGSVYEFDYNKNDCEQQFREIYCPRDCCGDKAKRLASGRDHVVILTEKNKIYGAGDNSEYQLVPQGQCRYDCAVEIIIADTNVHDDCCCNQFTGFYNPLSTPVIPGQGCGRPFCFSNSVPCYNFGTLIFSNLDLTTNMTDTQTPNTYPNLSLNLPLFMNYNVSGTACTNTCGNISGNLTFTIANVFMGDYVCPTTKLPIASDATLNGLPFPFPSSMSIPIAFLQLITTPISISISIPEYTLCNTLGTINSVPTIQLSFAATINLEGSITFTVYQLFNGVLTPIYTHDIDDITISTSGPVTITQNTNGTSIVYTIPVSIGTLSYMNNGNQSFTFPNLLIPINCCASTPDINGNASNCCNKASQECCPLPQPCWQNVYAGFNTTVLVDSCHRLYVLGNLHRIRSNKHLLRKNCLEELLSNTTATVTLPADQLNCCVRPKNGSCRCPKCKDKCFKTDLSKFGVQLNFANGYCVSNDDCACPDGTAIRTLRNKTNVCDFLKALQNCNEYPTCDDTCEPCDTTIYLNICGSGCGCTCGNVPLTSIGTITLYNRKSVCKYVSQSSISCRSNIGGPCNGSSVNIPGPTTIGCYNKIRTSVNLYSVIEWDLNRYCIDAHDFPLDQIISLQLNTGSTNNVNMYVDICKQGAIKLVSCNVSCFGPSYYDEIRNSKRYTFDFPIFDSNQNAINFALNYGNLLDPLELTNLKLTLGLSCGFPCSCYRNPLPDKLIFTYLRGGDRVRFYIPNTDQTNCSGSISNNLRIPVTADVPTVFTFRNRVLDIAVGDKNLSVLIGSAKCPNEVYALGENCYGELGINGTSGISNNNSSISGLTAITNNETVLCFYKLNRCLFDCQVERIFAGKHITFYITQSYRVYSSGSWKCLDQSNIPICIPSICQAWRIIYISAANNHVVLLGKDGCIFGFGNNNLGELGLCHTHCVKKPVPLVFFYRLNQCAAKKFYENFKHPILKYYDGKCCNICYLNPCKCTPCTPCPSICEYEEKCKKRKKCNENFKCVEEYKIKCESCGYDPCKCGVKYIKYGRKYSANGRCCRK